LNNLRGTLGVARSTADNSGTSQFYINVADNPGFDYVSAAQPGYAVFGKVISGMATADAIAAVPTAVSKGMADVPVTPVVINSVTQTQ
jgi:cyclophilin family peptidyl-prolyl cis-trans isomerase